MIMNLIGFLLFLRFPRLIGCTVMTNERRQNRRAAEKILKNFSAATAGPES
jgi:hypothetical protein